MSTLPEGTTVNIVEFFVLPKTAQPTIRMTFDVQMPKLCDDGDVGMDTTQRRFQTEVVVPGLVQPVSQEARDAALTTGWDQIARQVELWTGATAVCPVGKSFCPTNKCIT